MEDGNRLGKTAVRCMALHLRMMRLLGRMSLGDIELLLEQGRIHHYEPGDTIPVSGHGRRYHLLVLEGEITVLQEQPCSGSDHSDGSGTLKATDAVYGYAPLLLDTNQQLTATAGTSARCLLLDADLADRFLGDGQGSTAFLDGRRIA
jgi:CRP-like cAMP-binding protein